MQKARKTGQRHETVCSLPDISLLNWFPSESTHESTLTKSAWKLGTEHLNMASLPVITLSRNMSTSKCWFVTERFKQINIHNQRDRLESYEVSNLDKIQMVDDTRWISQFQSLGVNPAENSDKITDETRNGTFEQGVVAENHGLVERVRIINLT